jgi:long-subunit fatty acid transport protein
MSNDAKFWAWRLAAIATIVIEFGLLMRVLAEAINPHGHIVLWAVLFFVVALASIPLSLVYTVAKRDRWGSAYESHPDLEALNAYAKQQAAEKAKAKQPPKKAQ